MKKAKSEELRPAYNREDLRPGVRGKHDWPVQACSLNRNVLRMATFRNIHGIILLLRVITSPNVAVQATQASCLHVKNSRRDACATNDKLGQRRLICIHT